MSLPKVAYFSMEMAIDQALSTYAGGLGFLAGSHMQSAGHLDVPMVGVCILWSYGYYDQRIDADGNVEIAYFKKHYDFLTDTGITVDVQIYGQNVKVKAFKLEPEIFGTVPIYFLSTDIPENSPEMRQITHRLYDANERTRVNQEIVLGIGGVRVLEAAKYDYDLIHMNEGHALPAAFELLNKYNGDLDAVREKTVFTTHTPVSAGNEVHWIDMLNDAGFFAGVPKDVAIGLGGENFSLTVAALKMSRMANSVSQLHGLVYNKMWENVEEGCPIIAITNAVNLNYWQDERVKKAQTSQDLLDAKFEMKKELFKYIAGRTGKRFDPNVLTITWARRFADYKRAWLILMNRDRIGKLLKESKVQLIFSGKFHPADTLGRDMFNNILKQSYDLPNVVVLPNYELELSSLLKKGTDVWLNTPTRPLEASGTSGEKAVMNGVMNFSVLDGWWAEGYLPGAGWAIEEKRSFLNQQLQDELDAEIILNTLEQEIIPMYYEQDQNGISHQWIKQIKNTIAKIAPPWNPPPGDR